MSDDMSSIFNQMNASLRSINTFASQILSVLRTGFEKLASILNNGFMVLSKLQPGGYTNQLWDSVGIAPGKGKAGRITEYLQALFSGTAMFADEEGVTKKIQPSPWTGGIRGAFSAKGQIPSLSPGNQISPLNTLMAKLPSLLTTLAHPGQLAGKIGGAFMGMGGGTANVLSGLGSSLMASFGPLGILLQLLQPLISAFLEPLEMLTPMMEMWGTILSQLLVPVMLMIMAILEPFTPVIISLTQALLPIIELVLGLMTPLLPLINVLAWILDLVLKLVGWLTNFASIGSYFSQYLTGMVQEGITRMKENFLNGFVDMIQNAVERMRALVLGAFDNIKNKSKDWWDSEDRFWN